MWKPAQAYSHPLMCNWIVSYASPSDNCKNSSLFLPQMLNCCIEHKRARDESRKEGGRDRKTSSENGLLGPESGRPEGSGGSPGKSWDSWSDSEEEFFECLSDTEEMKEVQGEGAKGTKAKPEGRLQPHGKLTLLNSDEPLYIPVTQVSTFSHRCAEGKLKGRRTECPLGFTVSVERLSTLWRHSLQSF